MTLSSINVDAFQKFTKAPYFLFASSATLFADIFLIVSLKTSLPNMPTEWPRGDLTVTTGVYFTIALGMCFAVLTPAFIAIYSQILIILGKDHNPKSLKEGCFSIHLLREYAVVKNEPVAYAEYQRLQSALQETKFIDLCCFSLAILLPLDWFLSSDNATSLVVFFYQQTGLIGGFLGKAVSVIFLISILGILTVALRKNRFCDEYEHNFEIASMLDKWCEEKRTEYRSERNHFEIDAEQTTLK